jgi:RNA polymerase sigma-70 factor (ECF subfamily)
MAPSINPRPSPGVAAAFARRDPSAVRSFYRDYGRLVFAVAHRVLRRRDLAEEATQQTFVRAWQAADRLDIHRDPAPWLATIAKRVAIDILRHETKAQTRLPLAPQIADDARLDIVWDVRAAIDTLPADEAAIIRLQHLEGFTQAEIAARLGIAIGTVKSRSHRAHRKLATALMVGNRLPAPFAAAASTR